MAIGQQREPFRPSIMNTNRQFAFYRYSSIKIAWASGAHANEGWKNVAAVRSLGKQASLGRHVYFHSIVVMQFLFHFARKRE